MVIMPNGSLGFDNIYDMYYDLFNEIGLSLNAQTNILYDQDTGNPLMLKDKYIKASIDGRPVYPGKNDIIFEPDKNYPLIKSLYLFYVDKCVNGEDGDTLGYIADYIDDDEAKEKQRVVIKTKLKGEIYSNFYWQIYLAYIDNIFRIAGYNIDLSNFDVKPEK